MHSFSPSLSALPLIPLSIFIFDTASASTDFENTSQPKSRLITQTYQQPKSFEIAKLEVMKMICGFRACISGTATDQEIIDAVLREIEEIKQSFPGGRLTFSATDAERHIKDAKNKRTFKRRLSESFKSFPKAFHLNFDLKAFECEAEEELVQPIPYAQSIIPTSANKESANKEKKEPVFARGRLQKISANITFNNQGQKKQDKKPTEGRQETHALRTPGRFILSAQTQILSTAHYLAEETRENKTTPMEIIPFSNDNDGGSSSSGNHPFEQSTGSFISPYFLSYKQSLDFKIEKHNPKPETLVTRSWMIVSRLWDYYPQVCLMVGTGLLSIANTLLSRRAYARRRFSYINPYARTFVTKA